MPNPCLECGACCAFYRVSFHWSEAEPFLGGKTPSALTVQVAPHYAAMAGTQRQPPRCVALEGAVGAAVSCSIYAERPSPCRDLEASWVDGRRSARCDRARAAHGLPPLEPPAHKPIPRQARRR